MRPTCIRILDWPLLAAAASLSCGASDGGHPRRRPRPRSRRPLRVRRPGAAPPDFLRRIGCRGDFDALSSQPLDASIPGARSVKFLVDTLDGDAFYLQNSKKYQVHFEFATAHLSGNGKPLVGTLMKFNQTEYYSTTRRFILGSLTHYEGPKPLGAGDRALRHRQPGHDRPRPSARRPRRPSSARRWCFTPPPRRSSGWRASSRPACASAAPPRSTRRSTTSRSTWPPASAGCASCGPPSWRRSEYLSFRDIVVLDQVPNDLSVTLGIITEQFQTPLSHINVLSQTRKIPNMALRNAFSDRAPARPGGQVGALRGGGHQLHHRGGHPGRGRRLVGGAQAPPGQPSPP